MRKIAFSVILTLSLLFCACHKQSEPVALKVIVSNAEQAEGKGPTTIDSTQSIKAISLIFFKKSDHSVALWLAQYRNDFDSIEAQFGVFNIMLDPGMYDMVVVGYGDSQPLSSLDYQNILLPTATMVFHAIQTVNVTEFGQNEITTVLQRITSRFAINTTDNVPGWVDHLTFSFSASGLSINPVTGCATSNNGFSWTLGGMQSIVGQSRRLTVSFPLHTNETTVQTMDVTIGVYDTLGMLRLSRILPGIPFLRNRTTFVSGALYHQDANTGFTVNTDWLDEYSGGTF